jgi:type II secretory pathway pseudopilin PulG
MSLVEILVAIALAGLLAMLVLPKFRATNEEVMSTKVGKTAQTMQLLVTAVQLYEKQTGTRADLNQVSLDTILQTDGNYFAYKNVAMTPLSLNYFLMADGSRLSTQPELFVSSDTPLPEYDATDLTPSLWANQNTGAESFCGDYPQSQCFYVDINGRLPPNKVGKDGDIIPLRIDPASNRVQTLYAWEREDRGQNQWNKCSFVSIYDLQNDPAGVASCTQGS